MSQSTRTRRTAHNRPDLSSSQRPSVQAKAHPDGIALPADLLERSTSEGDLKKQGNLLNNSAIPSLQRQRLAVDIGQAQGNLHLQRAIASVQPDSSRALQPSPRVIQRRPLQGVVGQDLATISFYQPGEISTENFLRAEAEMIPEGTPAERFTGFETRLEAYARAWASPNLCAVVEDTDGRFHTLQTDWTGQASQAQVTIMPFQHVFRRVWWVNVPGRQAFAGGAEPSSWPERVDRVRGWYQAWKLEVVPRNFVCPHSGQHGGQNPTLDDLRQCVAAEFAQLLAQLLSLSRSEVHIAQSEGDFDPNAMITFDIFLDDALGKQRGGEVEDEAGHTPTRPGVCIGPDAFNSVSYLHTLATAIHETTHFAHARQNINLFEQWQQSKSRLSFEKWLERELRRRRITQEQHDLAKEDIKSSDHSTSEVLSYVEGFTAIYHRLPLDESGYRFQSLNKLAGYWFRASHEVQESSVSRLGTYYQSLPPAHQQDFANYARRQESGMQGKPSHYFWSKIVSDSL